MNVVDREYTLFHCAGHLTETQMLEIWCQSFEVGNNQETGMAEIPERLLIVVG